MERRNERKANVLNPAPAPLAASLTSRHSMGELAPVCDGKNTTRCGASASSGKVDRRDRGFLGFGKIYKSTEGRTQSLKHCFLGPLLMLTKADRLDDETAANISHSALMTWCRRNMFGRNIILSVNLRFYLLCGQAWLECRFMHKIVLLTSMY